MHRNIYCSAWCIVDAQYIFVAEYGLMVGYLSWIRLTSSKRLALAQSPGPKFQLLLDILGSISQWYTNSPRPTGSSAASTQVSFLPSPLPLSRWLLPPNHRGLKPEVVLDSSSLFSPTPKHELVSRVCQYFLGNTSPIFLPLHSHCHCHHHWPSLAPRLPCRPTWLE